MLSQDVFPSKFKPSSLCTKLLCGTPENTIAKDAYFPSPFGARMAPAIENPPTGGSLFDPMSDPADK